MISEKLVPFGTTIFSEMSRLAQESGAINLSQGFPDFEGPPGILEAAVKALHSQENQYARSMGHPLLVKAIANKFERDYGHSVDPMEQVVVFCGATEGIAASLLGILNPGDEVILLEPFYDSYPAGVAMAGAIPRYCTLEFPEFAITRERLLPLFNQKTRMLILNSPHNPSGRVFCEEELAIIADLCKKHDALVLADEVYEHLTYSGHQHRPIATLPGMWDRTLTLSSTGKTFSFTGWKIGWAVGPTPLIQAAQAAHQFLTFAVATPLQVAMASALEQYQSDYFAEFQASYQQKRDFLVATLREAGLQPLTPEGTYFVLADFSDVFDGDDQTFARKLIEQHGVAAIPPSGFYRGNPKAGQSLIRFAFCKSMATLEAAAERLRGLQS